jgi:hypothetical protein
VGAIVLGQADAYEPRVVGQRAARSVHSQPYNESTIDYPEAGVPDARATIVGPFLVVWRFVNAEVLAVATIRWGPDADASARDLSQRM